MDNLNASDPIPTQKLYCPLTAHCIARMCPIVAFPHTPGDGPLCPFLVATQRRPGCVVCDGAVARRVRRNFPLLLDRFPSLSSRLSAVSSGLADSLAQRLRGM